MQHPSTSAHGQRRYRVGDLEVDVDRVRVLRGETEIVLPRLTFDLLVAIVEIAPTVATSDALLARVWPGLVVSPETLVQRVKLLRAALGDDPRHPRYLAVVRGRGYRLLPDVQRLPPEARPPLPDAQRPSAEAPRPSAEAQPTSPEAQRVDALGAAAPAASGGTADSATGRERRSTSGSGSDSESRSGSGSGSATGQRDRDEPPDAARPDARGPARHAASARAGPFDRSGRPRVWLATAAVALGALGLVLALAPRERSARDAPESAPDPNAPGTRDGAAGVAGAPAAPPASPAPSAVGRRSIAVLPFEALSRDPDDAVYARGIAEAVLHQLGTLRELEVIARRSSFTFGSGTVDAREVGRRLGVRYLLEGTVQREGQRLRVTAQLVDASTATQVWSMRVERPHRDLFAVEDEIAAKVAEAFDLSTTSPEAARLKGQGTRNVDAYLEFLRARQRLASDRVADLDAAIVHLRRALDRDRDFAPAYVALADAEVRRAEFAPSESRADAFGAARARAREHVERALALDPHDGAAYLQRAYLHAFTDLAAAEADYERGLARAPNDADGYAGLATVVYADPRRTDEALRLIDRARRLDPLEPRYDVTKAIVLAYARDDVAGALALLRGVLERHPAYVPGMARYGELLMACTGETAEGIRWLSRALAADPASEWVRRQLVSAYLDVGDEAAAGVLVGDVARAPAGRAVELHVYRSDWLAAGRAAYAAHAADAVLAPSASMAAIALRMHARATREYDPARRVLERAAGVEWDADGEPSLEEPPGIKEHGVNAAHVLLLAGQPRAAQRLLRAVLADMDFEATELRRGTAWSARSRATALALLGERDAALAVLAAIRGGQLQHRAWYFLEREIAFEPQRSLPAFTALVAEARARRAAERARLETLRAAGEIHSPAALAPRAARGATG